jgi:4-amino-4-deoxy-L-arabinose transferase-like glycosyltransferase
MFYFTRLLTKSTSAAVISSVFLTSAIPLLILGAAIYTDMAGYFFILLGAFLIVKWDLPRANLKRVVLAGVVVQAGMLARESVACVLLFAIVWCLLSRGSFRCILLFAGIVVGLSVLWSTLVGFSYFQWYMLAGVSASPYPKMGFLGGVDALLRSIVYAFGEIPIVLLLSFLGFLRIHDSRKLNIYVSFLIAATLVIVTFPVPGTRYSFILFPAILPLAGVGVDETYSIILQSPLISTIWGSFKTPSKALLIFQLLIMVAYVAITNLLTIRYVSFPWNPLIDPSLPPGYIQFLRNY